MARDVDSTRARRNRAWFVLATRRLPTAAWGVLGSPRPSAQDSTTPRRRPRVPPANRPAARPARRSRGRSRNNDDNRQAGRRCRHHGQGRRRHGRSARRPPTTSGDYEIPLPGPGQYSATLDPDSLPKGVKLTDPTEDHADVHGAPGPAEAAAVPVRQGHPRGRRAPPTASSRYLIEGVPSRPHHRHDARSACRSSTAPPSSRTSPTARWSPSVRSWRSSSTRRLGLHLLARRRSSRSSSRVSFGAGHGDGPVATAASTGLVAVRPDDRQLRPVDFLLARLPVPLRRPHPAVQQLRHPGRRRGTIGNVVIPPKTFIVIIISVIVLVAASACSSPRPGSARPCARVADNGPLASSSGINTDRVDAVGVDRRRAASPVSAASSTRSTTRCRSRRARPCCC